MLIRNIRNEIEEHEELRRIELKYLPKHMVAEADTTIKWSTKNPNTTIVAIDNNNIVGHCSIFPITKRFHDALISGQENDVELDSVDILKDENPIRYLYFAVICVEKEYRKSLTRDLLNKYIEIYDNSTDENTAIIVEYCTEDGYKFIRNYGFKDTQTEDKKVQYWKEFKSNVLLTCK